MGCCQWYADLTSGSNMIGSFYLLSLDLHYIEVSSLTGENVESPFALAARSVLLAIESGTLDPEKPGSGVSYGDRSLRRVSSGSRLSVTLGLSDGRKKGLLGRGGKCC